MGGTSKFKFPLPHRRSKQPTVDVQSISSPMTNKAQKLLGTAEINVDSASPTSSNTDPSKFWDTRSAVSGVSGISVTISESTATGTVTRTRSPLSTLQESTVTPSGRTNANGAAWDQESDIIPKGLGMNGSSAGRTHNLETITDASSLRRRRSSSTIASYYDKTKLPLSISQQTSNSAMAKGLPNKAFELLNMDSPRPAPSPPTQDRRKPPKLDLTHLLPTAGTSSRNPLSRLSHKRSMVLGPDLMTRSPSILSSSSAVSPSEGDSKSEKKPRKKLTRESLRSLRSRSDRSSTAVNVEEPETASIRKRATDAGTLYQLYEHYEHTSYRDTMTTLPQTEEDTEQDEQAIEPIAGPATRRGSRQSASSSSTRPRHHVAPSSTATSRHPYAAFSPDSAFDTTSEMSLSGAKSSLASPPTDYAASVSSRHTRTSKASKWTDQSFTDFDPNATSVLSLSSDSEDDSSEPPRTAMSVPSIASMDSMSSPPESRRPSNTSISQESIRKQPKSKFRSSLNLQGHFLAIPEDAKSAPGTAQPAVNARTTSLATALANASTTSVSQPNAASSIASSGRSQKRLSQVSTSTSESVASQHSRPRPSGRQTPEVRHIAMFQSRAVSTGNLQQEFTSAAEKPREKSRKHSSPHITQPTPPIASSSLDAGIESQHRSPVEYDGPVLTLNGNGGVEDERFMAVTRQEELLLAAMRARRALMRENHQIADLEFLDRAQLEGDKTASKKESLSSLKTVKGNAPHPPPQSELPPLPPGPSPQSELPPLPPGAGSSNKKNDDPMTMLFPKPPSAKSNQTPTEEISEMEFGKFEAFGHPDRTTSKMPYFDSPKSGSNLKKFEQTSPPPSSSTHYASHSRAASATPTSGYLTHPKSARQKSSPRPDSDFMPMARPFSVQATHKPDMPSRGPSRNDWHPAEVEPVMERPESSSSSFQDEEFERQQPPSRKKAVRISAVGMQLPEIGQWGDDG